MEALGWYESAAEKGEPDAACQSSLQANNFTRIFFAAYAHFLTGPPGGRTLPLTPTKQSDLAGGVFGPGASWASTGPNSHRSAIRAANAAASGERYDDVLEYYQVGQASIGMMSQVASILTTRAPRTVQL
jgi:hypothetical protein